MSHFYEIYKVLMNDSSLFVRNLDEIILQDFGLWTLEGRGQRYVVGQTR